jgi:hypothetical protein
MRTVSPEREADQQLVMESDAEATRYEEPQEDVQGLGLTDSGRFGVVHRRSFAEGSIPSDQGSRTSGGTPSPPALLEEEMPGTPPSLGWPETSEEWVHDGQGGLPEAE